MQTDGPSGSAHGRDHTQTNSGKKEKKSRQMDLQTVHITMPLADEGSNREASTLASMKTDTCKKTTAQAGVQTDQQIRGMKRDKQAERAAS